MLFPRAVRKFALLSGFCLLCAAWPAQAVVITFTYGQPNPITGQIYTGVSDLPLSSNFPNDNGGATQRLFAGTNDTTIQRSLLRFDVSSLAGRFTTINSVTLRLTYVQAPQGSPTAAMYSITSANGGWVEGNGTIFDGNFDADDQGVSTWKYLSQGATTSTGTNWAGSSGLSTSGTDYVATALASRAASTITSPDVGSIFDLTVSNSATATNLLNGWMDGLNEGVMIKDPNETLNTKNRFFFGSREDTTGANGAYWPQLIVDYNAVVTPEPFGLSLIGIACGHLATARRRRPIR